MNMSLIFDGFRLDNAHSTELVIGEYLMRKARQVKNSLIVFAELFTGDSYIDKVYSSRLGLNCLVRETQIKRDENLIYNSIRKKLIG